MSGSRSSGRMTAAVVLAAGLRAASRALAASGPWGVQVRSGRGDKEGLPQALMPSGAGAAAQATQQPCRDAAHSEDQALGFVL